MERNEQCGQYAGDEHQKVGTRFIKRVSERHNGELKKMVDVVADGEIDHNSHDKEFGESLDQFHEPLHRKDALESAGGTDFAGFWLDRLGGEHAARLSKVYKKRRDEQDQHQRHDHFHSKPQGVFQGG